MESDELDLHDEVKSAETTGMRYLEAQMASLRRFYESPSGTLQMNDASDDDSDDDISFVGQIDCDKDVRHIRHIRQRSIHVFNESAMDTSSPSVMPENVFSPRPTGDIPSVVCPTNPAICTRYSSTGQQCQF